jgi:LmbE family N-acetylglucosaminyl deacetylase
VFRTEDGGRGWAPIAGDRPDGWLAGDFRDRNGGVIAGVGQAALAGTNRFQPAAAPLLPSDVARQVRLTESNSAWLVGDAGLVLHSPAGGASWREPPTWPRDARRPFDFAALAVWGRHVWIAGTPGTRVFHSPDEGATWEEFSTDQPLPLRALFFLDENHGWSAGELGTILVTRDGGRSWLKQRGPGQRLAVLGLLASPQDTPWELLARLGNEGYLSGAEYVAADTPHSLGESPPGERVREAMLNVGGAATNIALGLQIEAPAPHDLGRLEEHLVRKIRQWRPDVVVTEPASPRIADPLRRLVHQAVLQAVAAAGDRGRFPGHEALCGLAPWSVKKVYSVQPPGEPGSVSIISASLAPRMGGTLADGAAAARAMLDDEFHPSPSKIELQCIADEVRQGARTDVMSGINLPSGGDARRRLSDPSPGSLDLVAKNAQKQRNIQQIIARAVEQSNVAVLGQVDELTGGVSAAAAGDVLFQLAERLRQQGRPDLAVEVYQRLVERHPHHDASEAALLRLIQYWASSEAARIAPRRAELRRGVAEAVAPAAFSAPVQDDEVRVGPQPALGAALEVRDASLASFQADQDQRDNRALALGEVAARSFPSLFAEPAVRFALAAAARRQKNPREAERLIEPLASRDVSSAWRQCAEGETWLMKPAGAPPPMIVRCPAAPKKPYLDGILDDAAWQDAPLMEINGTSATFAAPQIAPVATARLARDDEFLYFALRCQKSPGVEYSSGSEPRTYDGPLESRDRVELTIDLDRDYATGFRLAVDHRGWTNDVCVGAASWNPEWFVAAAEDHEAWTVEAAIPLRELSEQPPQRRDVWVIGLRRIVPTGDRRGSAARIQPDDFKLVLFE